MKKNGTILSQRDSVTLRARFTKWSWMGMKKVPPKWEVDGAMTVFFLCFFCFFCFVLFGPLWFGGLFLKWVSPSSQDSSLTTIIFEGLAVCFRSRWWKELMLFEQRQKGYASCCDRLLWFYLCEMVLPWLRPLQRFLYMFLDIFLSFNGKLHMMHINLP